MNIRHSRITELILAAVLYSCLNLAFAEGNDEKPSDNVEPEEEITVIDKRYKSPSVPRSFGSSMIRDWHAPDNKTLIIDVGARGKFKATFMSSCPGIRFTETIAFSTMGPFELDKSTKVILPDGRSCYFKTLELYVDENKADE